LPDRAHALGCLNLIHRDIAIEIGLPGALDADIGDGADLHAAHAGYLHRQASAELACADDAHADRSPLGLTLCKKCFEHGSLLEVDSRLCTTAGIACQSPAQGVACNAWPCSTAVCVNI
jgi:hypothetical protein